MPIYTVQNKKLKPISEKQFSLEKNIQSLTEDNLETLFGLTFVSGSLNQEFSVRVQEQDFYIDTLAFDSAQNSIVIIEYKKDRSFSVIDQGFAYLSAMLNHKADFVLELNERLHKSLSKKDIDWEQSRIIFISPEFTNYQRNAINFKDLPIYLYEVRLYDNDLVEFDPIKPYRTTESIGSLSKDLTIQTVSKEVKVYSEDDLLQKVEGAKELYFDLKEKISQLDNSIIFHPTKTYVGIQKSGNWRIIVGVNIYQNKLLLDYTRSKPSDFNDPKKKLTYREKSMKHLNQHVSMLSIESTEDVDYAVFLFEQAYKRFLEQYDGKV
ncbi:DUF5655 domain-containing protein [soil metagenome]